jgi:hypothetical protein
MTWTSKHTESWGVGNALCLHEECSKGRHPNLLMDPTMCTEHSVDSRPKRIILYTEVCSHCYDRKLAEREVKLLDAV